MSSLSVSEWRVILNTKLWSLTDFERDFNNGLVSRIAQSKGKAKMKVVPSRGDIVHFVARGNIVMEGIVESDEFIQGICHQEDRFNRGSLREHAESEEFVWICVKRVGLCNPIRRTGQRTWVKLQ